MRGKLTLIRDFALDRYFFGGAIFLILQALLLALPCGPSVSDRLTQQVFAASPEEERMQVEVAEIRPWQSPLSRQFPGVIRPVRRAFLSTRMNGSVRSIEVQAGDYVEEGQILAIIESRDVQAAVRAAGEQLQAAQRAHDHAVKNVRRLERLYAKDLISRNRMEEAQVRERELEAGVEQARSELRIQRVNLSYARISAPFTGFVGEVVVDEGAFVGPGSPVLILEDRSETQIDVPVPREIAARVSPDDSFAVDSPLLAQPVQAAFVAVIPVQGDAAVGQTLRLLLQNPPDTLQPGQAVQVLIRESRVAEGELVGLPQSALIRRGQLTSVLVVEEMDDEYVLRLRWISTTAPETEDQDLLPVRQGLEAGEMVVLDPSLEMRDGQLVRPGEWPH
ncbi:MAG: efflux RND transporter periplasmic adaptor subunit [Desulfonatronovibrio sp.]